MPVMCIYTLNSNNKNPNFFDTKILKDSLSKALVPFYPLAGRFTKNKQADRIEIDFNAKGVLFIEAMANPDLVVDDLIDKAEIRSSFVPKCDYSRGISSFPLLMIQVTKFKCGGVCVGIAMHHYVADGYAYWYFYESWGRFARGVELSVEPSFERRPYLSDRDPPQVKFEHLEFEPPLPPILPLGHSSEMTTTQERLFKFSQQQIKYTSGIKSKFKEAKNSKISTYEVIAARVWQSACKARGLRGDRYVKLYIPMDVRSKLEDPALTKAIDVTVRSE